MKRGLPVSTLDIEWGGEFVPLRDAVLDVHTETEKEGDPVLVGDREGVREGVLERVMEGEVEVESKDVLEVEGVTVVVKVGVTVLVMDGRVDVVVSGEGVGERESNTVVVGKEVEVSVVEPESDIEGDRVGDKDTVPVDVPVVDSVGE